MAISPALDMLIDKILRGEVRLDGRLEWVEEIYTWHLEQQTYDPVLRMHIEKTVKPLVVSKIREEGERDAYPPIGMISFDEPKIEEGGDQGE